ncbi:MAG: hypothetical protein WDN50_16925 [Bradyrhizobium sp.]
MNIFENQYPELRFSQQENHQLFNRRGASGTDNLPGEFGLRKSEPNDFIEQGQPAQKRGLTG